MRDLTARVHFAFITLANGGTGVSPELQQLIALQELDIKIQQLAEKLAAVPIERERIEQDFKNFAAEYHRSQELRDQALERRKSLELELKVTQEKLEKYKQDLMKVRNEKEYGTVLREIDSSRKYVSQLETQILEAIEEAETLEKQLQEMTPDIATKRSEINAQLDAFSEEMEAAAEESKRYTSERHSLAVQVKSSLLKTYDRVAKLRKGVALTEARDYACTACRMSIRPQVFSDVRRGEKIIQCDSCGRILYFQAPPQPAKPAAELSI